MKIYQFTVPGVPVPKGRPRVTRFGTYTPPKTREYENRVRRFWQAEGLPMIPAETPIRVIVHAWMPLPMSMSLKKRIALDGKIHLGHRADVDNIAKSVCDALNGVAYKDDCAIWRIEADKRHHNGEGFTDVVLVVGEEDGAEREIWEEMEARR